MVSVTCAARASNRILLPLAAAAILACDRGERPAAGKAGPAADSASDTASHPPSAAGILPGPEAERVAPRSDPHSAGWGEQPKDPYFTLAEELDSSPDAGWSEDQADAGDTAAVLTLGDLHGDEVPDDAAERSWLGLFADAAGAYAVERALIRVTPAFDEIVDKDSSAPTGKRVSAAVDRPYTLLVEDGGLIRQGPVPALGMAGEGLAPGRRMAFTFLGVGYRLAATFTDRGYRLFLTAIRDGKETTQMILYAGGLDDRTPSLVFAGDLDGDGLLDLILDDSGHYNVSACSLYLSGAAGGGKPLRRVGTHRTTGC